MYIYIYLWNTRCWFQRCFSFVRTFGKMIQFIQSAFSTSNNLQLCQKRNTTKMFTPSKTQQKLGGGNSFFFFMVTRTPGEVIQFSWSYVLDGLKINQKTNGESFVSNTYLKLLSLIGVGREPSGIISGCYMCDRVKKLPFCWFPMVGMVINLTT